MVPAPVHRHCRLGPSQRARRHCCIYGVFVLFKLAFYVDRGRFCVHTVQHLSVVSCPRVYKLQFTRVQIRARGRLLHWAFVVQLLNDLFGIQVRSPWLCVCVLSL